jgi:hypothetical protein
MWDGVDPFPTLVLILLSQYVLTIVTLALQHFFNPRNESKMDSLYQRVRQDLQTIAFRTRAFQGNHFTPEGLQAGSHFSG